jgi:type 1 glutamine amidotransferase/HEAT repeat protein
MISSKLRHLIPVLTGIILFNGQPLTAQVSPQELEKIENALPEKAPVEVQKPRKLLVFSLSEGYQHSAIPYAATMLELMGAKTGAFETVYSEDMSVFSPAQLNQFDAVCFNNTTQLTFDKPEWRESLMAFVKAGKGVIGLHAATDNFYNWPEAAEMMGGVFAGHPWGASGTWKVKINDPDSPITKAFQGKSFSVKDEIYRVNQRRLRETSRVLVSLDMTDPVNLAAKGVKIDDRDVPISWIRTMDKGRVFYCSFGHNPEIYWNAKILQHYLAGIQYALGDLKADATPVPFDVEAAVKISEIKDLLALLSTYEYGQSLENETKLQDLLRLTSKSQRLSDQIETEMIAFLKSPASLPGKQFICHTLSIYGTKKSVPVLMTLLADPATANMALYALERIPAPEIGEALTDKLDASSAEVKTGIINVLAQRRVQSALPELISLMNDKDPLISSAAIRAVGVIGGEEAAEAIATARETNKDDRQLTDAYLQVAQLFSEQGAHDKAFKIYKDLYSHNESQQVQYAALRGMILNAEKEASSLILQAIRSEDKNEQASAIQLVRQIPADEDISPIARMLPELSASGQVQLISALAGRRDPEVTKILITEAGSDNEDIQVAALKSLSLSQDPAAVPLFAEKAAISKGRIRITARESLYRINGPGVNEKILSDLPGAEAAMKIEYIRALAERSMTEGIPLLLTAMNDSDENIRMEAIKAMREVGTPAYMEKVLADLINPKSEAERKELEKAVIAMATKIPDGQPKTTAIIRELQSSSVSKTSASLLDILGKIGDAQALPIIRSSLKSKDPEIQVAAIRALSEWPDSQPLDDLLQIAEKSTNEKFRILALRGYVRLISFEKDKSSEEILNMYQKGMQLAGNSEEKRAVLSGLASVYSLDALSFSAKYIDDNTLKQEAAATVISIASKLNADQIQSQKPLLYKAKSTVTNEELKEDCQEIINKLEKFEDFITVWQAAGPYDKASADLFTYVFPPETNEPVEWKKVPEHTDKDNYWHVDLGKFYGNSGPVAYLRSKIFSDKDQEVQLQVGSNDGIKVFLNGKTVHENNVGRTISPGEDKVNVKLDKGWNTLILKIVNQGGGWGGCARIRNLEGGKLEGLKFE